MNRHQFGRDFVLELNKESIIGDELSITLIDIFVEKILPSPFDDDSYPSGSGVTVGLRLKHGKQIAEITLTQLSEGYTGDIEQIWLNYKITLLAGDLSEAIFRVDKVKTL